MSCTDFTEFDSDFLIPDIVETPLTLEEILKQNDDDFKLENIIDEQDVNLLESNQSELEFDFLKESESSVLKETSFNITELSFIKSQIQLTKDEKINSGNPTCLAVSKNYICIGTFNGHILVLEISEKLKCFLKNEPEFGSIAAMSINHDESKLICGGSKGAVALWNLNNGEMLRLMIDDLHAPFSSIINLKYLSDSNFVILSDTSGSVFVLDTRKKDFDSQCIFSGSRGEVLSLHPLILDNQSLSSFKGIESLCLVAMATVSKIIVVSVRPGVFVHFTCPLKSRSEYLPVLSWNFSFKHQNKIIPLLAFGRQNQLFINKLVTDFVEKIEFLPLFQFNASDYIYQHVCWINSNTLAVTDTHETIHLVDVMAQEEIESMDLSHIELVYENSHYKSLANGGFVSQAMAKAGEHACNNSFCLRYDSDRNKLFVLGTKSVYQISIRTWQEKVDFLIEKGYVLNALQVAHHKFTSSKSETYFHDDSTLQHNLLKKFEYTFDCFENYIFEHGVLRCKNQFQLRQLISLCLDYCTCLESSQEKVFDLFEKLSPNQIAKCIFIECLEKFIFNGQLNNLNPSLVKEIVEYYIDKQWYNLLDNIIIHFEITSLDIDFIMRIFTDYYLYDSYIYICNHAFKDFIGPFDKLLKLFSDSTESKSQYCDQDIVLGNKLLVYLSCLFTGTYYPNKGAIPENEQKDYLQSIYSHIIRENQSEVNILTVLLNYDSTEFLNVILIAFDYLDKQHSELSTWKQALVDALLNVFTGDHSGQFVDEQKSAFYLFLARCLINSNSIQISESCFDQMIDLLFSVEMKRFEERQQILIQFLMNAKYSSSLNESLFLENATKNNMFKICEHIHRNNRNWIKLFYIYIEDSSKNIEIFEYIQTMLAQDHNWPDQSAKENFLNVIFDNFSTLFQLDCQKAMTLFYLYFEQFDDLFITIVSKMNTQSKVLHQFLKLSILHNRLSHSKSLTNSDEPAQKIFQLSLNSQYQEMFIELACQFEPENILTYLEILQEYSDGSVLKICNSHCIKDGEAYLYEKIKQYDKSFEILFKDFEDSVDNLIKSSLLNLSNNGPYCSFDSISDKFLVFLNFCARSSKFNVEVKTKEKYWISILELLIEIKFILNNIRKLIDERYLPQYLNLFADTKIKERLDDLVNYLSEQFKSLFEKLINNMLGHFNLVVFLDLIINKVLQQSEDMFDIREMLLCVLDNYNYEKTLLELTNNILSCEHHTLMNMLRATNTKSKNVRQLVCAFCFRSTASTGCKNAATRFVIYNCNHLLHYECLEMIKNENNLSDIKCPLCAGFVDENLLRLQSLKNELFLHNSKSDSNSVVTRLNQLGLNESQLRALNYFHHKRLK